MFNAKAVLFALTAVSAVLADHQITVVNNCSSGKNAHVKNANWNHVSGLLGVGDKYSVSVPALASSFIVFGEDGGCPGPDGPGCTRLECDFSNPSFQQCNLSAVAGFSIPLSFGWSDGSCQGASCENAGGSPANCWQPNNSSGASLRQCNAANVGVTLHLCG